MSSNGNGGGDDDIDDLIDEMRNTNSNLEDLSGKLDKLVEGIMRGTREEAGADETQTKIDLWDVGKISPGKASTPEEYIRLRARTAKNEDLSVPHISGSMELDDFFLEVYRSYGEHLQRIYHALNNDDWDSFCQKLAVMYGAEQELVDILDPGPSMFGIIVVDNEVDITPSKSHINFTNAYNNYWFSPSALVDFKRYSSPSEALGIAQDSDAESVFGRLDPVDVNESLAQAIDGSRGKSLPDEYRHLL